MCNAINTVKLKNIICLIALSCTVGCAPSIYTNKDTAPFPASVTPGREQFNWGSANVADIAGTLTGRLITNNQQFSSIEVAYANSWANWQPISVSHDGAFRLEVRLRLVSNEADSFLNDGRLRLTFRLPETWRDQLSKTGKALKPNPEKIVYYLNLNKSAAKHPLTLIDSNGQTVPSLLLKFDFESTEDASVLKTISENNIESKKEIKQAKTIDIETHKLMQTIAAKNKPIVMSTHLTTLVGNKVAFVKNAITIIPDELKVYATVTLKNETDNQTLNLLGYFPQLSQRNAKGTAINFLYLNPDENEEVKALIRKHENSGINLKNAASIPYVAVPGQSKHLKAELSFFLAPEYTKKVTTQILHDSIYWNEKAKLINNFLDQKGTVKAHLNLSSASDSTSAIELEPD